MFRTFVGGRGEGPQSDRRDQPATQKRDHTLSQRIRGRLEKSSKLMKARRRSTSECSSQTAALDWWSRSPSSTDGEVAALRRPLLPQRLLARSFKESARGGDDAQGHPRPGRPSRSIEQSEVKQMRRPGELHPYLTRKSERNWTLPDDLIPGPLLPFAVAPDGGRITPFPSRARLGQFSLIVDQVWAKDCAWTCGQLCCSSKSTIGRPPRRCSIPTSRDSTRLRNRPW